MAASEPSKGLVSHVPIFPPPTNAPCKLETWPEPGTAKLQAEMGEATVPLRQSREGEEEEPERWDGLS